MFLLALFIYRMACLRLWGGHNIDESNGGSYPRAFPLSHFNKIRIRSPFPEQEVNRIFLVVRWTRLPSWTVTPSSCHPNPQLRIDSLGVPLRRHSVETCRPE